MAEIEKEAPKAKGEIETAEARPKDAPEAGAVKPEEKRPEELTKPPTAKLQDDAAKASPGEQKRIEEGKARPGTSNKDLAEVLEANPLGDQRDPNKIEREARARVAATASLDLNPNFKFDGLAVSGLGLDSLTSAASKDSYLFQGLAASFADPFASCKSLDFKKGFCFDGLGQTLTGVFSPEQLKTLGFSSLDASVFNFDGKAESSIPGLSSMNWANFSRGLAWGSNFGFGTERENKPNDFGRVLSGDELKESGSAAAFFESASKQTSYRSAESWGLAKLSEAAISKSKELLSWSKETLGELFSDVTAVIGFEAKHETRTSESGAKVEFSQKGDKRIFSTDQNVMVQTIGKDGKADTLVGTKDGKFELGRTPDGLQTATNKNSDLPVLVKNDKTGKFEALDKSGKPVAQFDDKGDATRFFDNAITQIVAPGTDLNAKYQEYRDKLRKEISEESDPAKKAFLEQLKDKPVFLMDGNGESLSVRPDGTRYFTHADGKAEIIVPHWVKNPETGKGEPKPIEIRVTTGPDGKETYSVGAATVVEGPDGKKQYLVGNKNPNTNFFEMNSDQAAALIANSRVRRHRDGRRLEYNSDASGDQLKAKWQEMTRQDKPGVLQLGPEAHIDLRTGTMTVRDKDVSATYNQDQKTGTVTSVETKVREDGSLDPHPSRVMIFETNKRPDGKDERVLTIQAIDPETGNPKKDDSVSVRTTDGGKLEVDAWDRIHMDRDGTSTLTNDDGSKIKIDEKGDIDAKDKDGKSIFSTDGDKVSFDGGKTYEQLKQAYVEQEEREAINTATQVAQKIAGLLSGLLSGNIDPSLIAACESLLAAVVGELPPGIGLPPQVSEAKGAIERARAEAGREDVLAGKLNQQMGLGHKADLVNYAKEAATDDPRLQVIYALVRGGYAASMT